MCSTVYLLFWLFGLYLLHTTHCTCTCTSTSIGTCSRHTTQWKLITSHHKFILHVAHLWLHNAHSRKLLELKMKMGVGKLSSMYTNISNPISKYCPFNAEYTFKSIYLSFFQYHALRADKTSKHNQAASRTIWDLLESLWTTLNIMSMILQKLFLFFIFYFFFNIINKITSKVFQK